MLAGMKQAYSVTLWEVRALSSFLGYIENFQ